MRIADLGGIDMERWQDAEYGDLLTGSLWLIDRRDDSEYHKDGGGYHGNFVPQIPHQLIRRFTQPGDWVCDPFAGSGTTLIEAVRLGRNSVGIELDDATGQKAALAATAQAIRSGQSVNAHMAIGDCRNPRLWQRIALDPEMPKWVDLMLYHPPYHDIVKFSDDGRCLSNAGDVGRFLEAWRDAVQNTLPWLREGHYGALVVGDCYRDGEWWTLGDWCWSILSEEGMRLKGKIVKNVGETKAKGQNTNLWRYRALRGGFYTFAHEYIYVFQKPEAKGIERDLPAWRRPESFGTDEDWQQVMRDRTLHYDRLAAEMTRPKKDSHPEEESGEPETNESA